MDSGDESPLSSAPESDIELEPEKPTSKNSLNRKRKRPESPAREPTLADTPDIAVCFLLIPVQLARPFTFMLGFLY